MVREVRIYLKRLQVSVIVECGLKFESFSYRARFQSMRDRGYHLWVLPRVVEVYKFMLHKVMYTFTE